jgi:hypothetical protein
LKLLLLLLSPFSASVSSNINSLENGRFTTSKKELERQGVPKSVLDAVVKEATEPVNFNTGGGLKGASKSVLYLCDHYGEHEAFCPDDCLNAASIGCVVENKGRPYIWIPGSPPFFVSHASKLKGYLSYEVQNVCR